MVYQICFKGLAAESMKPSKLKRRFEKKHKEYERHDISFLKRNAGNPKKRRLNKTVQAHSTSKAAQ